MLHARDSLWSMSFYSFWLQDCQLFKEQNLKASSWRCCMTSLSCKFRLSCIPGSAGPEFSREAWLSVKYTLGLAFPNVSTHSLISSPGNRNGNVLYSYVHKHYVACRHCLYHCSQLPYLIDGDIKMTQSNAVSEFFCHSNTLCEFCPCSLVPRPLPDFMAAR